MGSTGGDGGVGKGGGVAGRPTTRIPAYAGMTVGGRPFTVIPAIPYRHSRVSGNPAAVGGQEAGLCNTVGIPAYAGMTVGGGLFTVLPAIPHRHSRPLPSFPRKREPGGRPSTVIPA